MGPTQLNSIKAEKLNDTNCFTAEVILHDMLFFPLTVLHLEVSSIMSSIHKSFN